MTEKLYAYRRTLSDKLFDCAAQEKMMYERVYDDMLAWDRSGRDVECSSVRAQVRTDLLHLLLREFADRGLIV